MDNESLYFIHSGFYSERTSNWLQKLLGQYDALICVGEFQMELARKLFQNLPNGPKLFQIHSSISNERIESLSKVIPDLTVNNIVFIGNGPSGWRGWYKGIDILLDAFSIAAKSIPSLTLTIVGEWDIDYVDSLLRERPDIADKTRFAGAAADLSDHLGAASLYVHPARGEAFGISVIEAMCAGVPAIVSELTGAKEAVKRVGEQFVVPVDAAVVAKQILNYFDMSPEERILLSRLSRDVANEYLEVRAIAEFQSAMQEIFSPNDKSTSPYSYII
jgi:glycosyltransferase involved in cell wall biosynthesis